MEGTGLPSRSVMPGVAIVANNTWARAVGEEEAEDHLGRDQGVEGQLDGAERTGEGSRAKRPQGVQDLKNGR